RYQSAKDMRAELQRLRRDTESGRVRSGRSGKIAAARESGPQEAVGEGPPASDSAAGVAIAASGSAATTVAPPTSSRTDGRYRLSSRAKLGSAAAVIIAATITGILYYRSHTSQQLTDKDAVVLADFR